MNRLRVFVKTPGFVFLFTNLVILFLLTLALNSQWRYHLESDAQGFYYPRYTEFIKTHTFANIFHNEYFPGAMFFFLLPGVATYYLPNTYDTYLTGLFIVNILLIWLHVLVYKKVSFKSPYIFLSILFFSGPLIFYRHDLFVSIFVAISIVILSTKPQWAAFLLGIATTIKIYPILIAPYYLLVEYKKGRQKTVIYMIACYISGILLPVIVFYLLSPTITSITEPLVINAIKPVHVESIWGSLLTLSSLIFNGHWARGLGANGIFGINPNYIYLPLSFYNYFWILPVSLFYLFIYKNSKNHFQTEIVFLIVLLFEIFSKILTGQYLFWFLLILPLIKFKRKINVIYTTVLGSLIVLLTQYIYPLHYNELLASFYANGSKPIYYYLLFFRNLLLIVLFIYIFLITFKRNE